MTRANVFSFIYIVVSLAASTLAKEVCYGVLGCFSNAKPFHNTVRHLPKSPEEIQARYLLYTRVSDDGVEIDYQNVTSLEASTFDASLGTKFIIHGFLADVETKPWIKGMKDAFLKQGDYNVVLVDWVKGAAGPNYMQAASNVRMLGKQVAKVIEMMEDEGLDLGNVHLIGHSLGAHLAGAAGRSLEGKVGRISGLDPAAPMFQRFHTDVRLDPSDAVFVDVIHSNGDPRNFAGFGVWETAGHVDFFPNDGEHQPGCALGVGVATKHLLASMFSDHFTPLKDLKGGLEGLICSHSRAHKIFTESITAPSDFTFTAVPCDSYSDFRYGKCTTCGAAGCNTAGFLASPDKSLGKQYFATRGESPYRASNYLVTLDFGFARTVINGAIAVALEGDKGNTSYTVLESGKILHRHLGSSRAVVAFDRDVGRISAVDVKIIPEDDKDSATTIEVDLVQVQHVPGTEIFKSEVKPKTMHAFEEVKVDIE